MAVLPATAARGWAFIDLAALGNNSWRRYAIALGGIALLPSICAAVLALVAGNGPIGGLLLQYLPIVVAGGVVIAGTVRLHRRAWRSLIAADLRIDWRRLAIGAGVELVIMLGQVALLDALTGWRLNLSLSLAPPVALLALCLIPLQAASEEILCRGYLTQALGRLVRSRIGIAALVGVIFGVLHFNTHGWLTVPYFFVLSLVFSLVSLHDEGLELAIGGHAAMNLFAFAAANSALVAPAAIGSESAAVMPFSPAAIGVLIFDGALFYGLTRLLVRFLCRPRDLAAPR